MKMNFLRPSMTPDQRLDWMDIARGMGMIMVVYGHSYGPENRYFYLFHMPLFFILSGYLYNEQHSFGQYFVKKLTSLYIPFAGWNLIVMLTRLVWADQNGFLTPELLEGRLENIRNMLLTVGKDGSYMGATWFLGSLFVISIAYKLVDMLVPAIKFRQIFIFLIFGGVAVYGFFVTIPNMQSRTLILGFFFALGRFMKLHEESFEHFTSPILAVLLIALFWVISNFTEADMGSNVYTNAPLFVVCAILGSLATITLAMCLERWSFRFAEVFRWPLRLIGKNSMDIMIWHFIAFRFVVAYQLYLEGTPLIQVFEVDSRYCTDGLWWLVYLAAGIIIPLIWGWFLKIGPWGWLLKKLRLVSA